MSASGRARRMARNHRRMARPARLNLVALMDIFTILVLFLIVNSGDVEVLSADDRVALPDSVSEQRPEATVIIKVTDADILFAGQSVITVDDAMAGEEETIAPLARALESAAAGDTGAADEARANGRPVVIMGDRSTPYALLKRIMATCAATDYRDISLAVNSVPAQTAPPAEDPLAFSGSSL